jgi:hypothetical protein
LAGEGLKIGRSHGCGCRRRAAERGTTGGETAANKGPAPSPRAAGPGDLPRGRLSHLGTSFGLGPDSRCRVADLHAPVWGIALGWRRQGENEIEREEEGGKREKNCSGGNADAWSTPEGERRSREEANVFVNAHEPTHLVTASAEVTYLISMSSGPTL